MPRQCRVSTQSGRRGVTSVLRFLRRTRTLQLGHSPWPASVRLDLDGHSEADPEESAHRWQVRIELVQLWWVPLLLIACLVLLVKRLI